MQIITEVIQLEELRPMTAKFYGEMVKAVVDIDREIIAVDADMHADLERLLLEVGSEQRFLWGINLYPQLTGDAFVEFDSMINLRPVHGNRSRSVEDPETRRRIIEVVNRRVSR